MATKCSNTWNVNIGDVLLSKTSKYLVQSFVGQGTFGLVAKCRNVTANRNVAIKIVKNESRLNQQTASEVKKNIFSFVNLMHIVPFVPKIFKSNIITIENCNSPDIYASHTERFGPRKEQHRPMARTFHSKGKQLPRL